MGRGGQETATEAGIGRRATSADGDRAADWRQRTRAGLAALPWPESAELYEVGGSIRDELLGREAKDLDVAVCGVGIDELLEVAGHAGAAQPLEVAGRLVGVRLQAPFTPKEGVELALARTESSTGSGHTDFAINTDREITIEDDLARRDFTCNAIARRINADGTPGELIDPYGGAEDLRNGVLRQTNPDALAEDPLRILRGLVRVARDDLRPDEQTDSAMRANAAGIRHLSGERVYEQMNKLLVADGAADALRLARDQGVLAETVPELEPAIGFDQESRYHEMTVDEHSLTVLQRACENEAPLEVRWAALLHDSGKPASAFRGKDGRLHFYDNKDDPDQRAHEEEGADLARQALRRLRADARTRERVAYLVRHHMFSDDNGFERLDERKRAERARRFLSRYGREHAEDLLMLRRCDRTGKFRGAPDPKILAGLESFEREVRAQWSSPVTLKELEIGGRELTELGLRGPDVGWALDKLLSFVIRDPARNTPERLREQAYQLARSRNSQAAEAEPQAA